MTKKNIIIYGATGFIGKNLTIFFSQNPKYKVTATYNQRPPFECPNVIWIKVNLLNHSSRGHNFWSERYCKLTCSSRYR